MSDYPFYENCLRCNKPVSDAEFNKNSIRICDNCRPHYFLIAPPAQPKVTVANKPYLAEEVFKILSLYPKIEVEKQKFVSDLQQLPDDTLLFLYQGLAEMDDLWSISREALYRLERKKPI